MEVERKNVQIELARRSIEEKAEQLALTSKYKNEFLANMSHELRTPLNSLLILSRLLAENVDGNLTPKQIEFATTIHASGSDLLMLINDILDLAKIESGTMTVDADEVQFGDLCTNMEQLFAQIARDKGLAFVIDPDANLPQSMTTDSKRLQQVLKNLLSNAFKFTEQGAVTLRLALATEGWNTEHMSLSRADGVVAFSVSDTGIGIPVEKQRIIFEAFQQADGTTSRKYGGTGLGLSISREIARLLGGEIRLASTPGAGSTFTLFLPLSYQPPPEVSSDAAADAARGRSGNGKAAARLPGPRPEEQELNQELLGTSEIDDDRDVVQSGDRVFLIVEDDPGFARILLGMAREKGFRGIVAMRGDTGLALARVYKPDAITLDIDLPVIGGWTIFDRLKHDPKTRHIPIHIISVSDERQRGLQMGAIAYLQKPSSPDELREVFTSTRGFVERDVRNLLVVEDDANQRQSIVELVGNGDVATVAVGSGADALQALQEGHFDCMVLDLGLPDMTGFELIERIKRDIGLSELPIIIYTGKELTRKEETELKRLADTIIVKDVKSMDRLLDETALFLHRVEANLPPPTRRILEQLHKTDPVLAGRKVLIVDDDVRNIFALTSVLERYEMQILYAENGKDGIEVLQNNPDINVILMDVMMPEMDGYETMRAIRKMRKFKTLPMIALTAKAMKGDREKCIEAGASDYITKPVDTEQLLSLLRVWLYK
jgi:CheY-like chemotaxis protein/nitrogen-specific signal transduction histidine kinase